MGKRIFTCAVSAALLLFGAGCVLFSNGYIEPNEFDLALPAPSTVSATAYPVKFGVFRNLSGSDRRFLVREAGDRMQTDEYNRWLLIPELLLERRLRAALPLPVEYANNGPELRLSATIYRFEFDRARQMAVLAVTYTVQLRGGNSFDSDELIEVPIEAATPEAAVRAMSAAVERSVATARRAIDRATVPQK